MIHLDTYERHTMKTKTIRGIGAAFIAGAVALVGVGALSTTAASASTVNRSPDRTVAFTPESNKASYWGENCVKLDQKFDTYTLTVEAKLILKSALVNDVWDDALPGVYGTKSGKQISHVIYCPIVKPTPTPTPSTTSPTPTPSETSETPTPTPSETSETPTPTPSETSETPTPTPTPVCTEPNQDSTQPCPTLTGHSVTPSATYPDESGGCPVPLTNGVCVLPKTGSMLPVLGGLAAGLLALGGGMFAVTRRKGAHL